MSVSDEDFLDDLDIDLGGSNENVEGEQENDKLQRLQEYIEDYRPPSLSDYKHLEPDILTKIPQMEDRIFTLLSIEGEDMTSILSVLNSLSFIAHNDILVIHNYLKLLYQGKFGELETLIPSPLQYANAIYIIETGQGQLKQDAELTKEQLMVLNMSMRTSFREQEVVDKHKLLQARDLLLAVSKIRNEINAFILTKIRCIAPNVCALVGPEVASLLLAQAGGISELSQVPSCNLASIGKNKHVSYELHTNLGGVKQEGYIYSSTLVQERPMEFRKQMLRMICAKVALASRVDAGGAKDDKLGSSWKELLLQKIQKIQDPPEISKTKPLPVPEDKPKKKRAGLKFRKYKQQFQLSHLRQLQNRMEFGKAEQSITDDTGEEIGLGMARSFQGASMATTGGAKMTKAMKRRLGEANDQAKAYMLSLDEKQALSPDLKNQKQPQVDNGYWFKHHLDKK